MTRPSDLGTFRTLSLSDDRDLCLIEHRDRSRDLVLWWRDRHTGYTTDLDEAGVYTREEAEGQARSRATDRAVPISIVRAAAQTRRSVDLGTLLMVERRAKEARKPVREMHRRAQTAEGKLAHALAREQSWRRLVASALGLDHTRSSWTPHDAHTRILSALRMETIPELPTEAIEFLRTACREACECGCSNCDEGYGTCASVRAALSLAASFDRSYPPGASYDGPPRRPALAEFDDLTPRDVGYLVDHHRALAEHDEEDAKSAEVEVLFGNDLTLSESAVAHRRAVRLLETIVHLESIGVRVPACNAPTETGSPGLGCSLAVGHEGGCKS